MEQAKLNKNDSKLLEFCKERPKSIREIAEHLGIAPKNVSVRIDKLKTAKFITVNKKGTGKKTLIKTKEDEKTKKYTLEILKALDKKGGIMNLNDFHSLNPFDPDKPDFYDKFHSTLRVQYSDLVDHLISLSEKGKKFIKENAKKK